MCRWVVPFKAATRFRETDQMSNRAYALILPKKHKGRPALCPVRSARVGAGLVVDYQRQLYEYWGPEADEEEEAASDTDDGSVEEIVVDDDDDVQGEGRENGSLRRVAPPLALDVAHYARAAGLDARAAEAARERYGKNVVEVRVPGFLELYREQLLSPIAMFQVFTSLLWLLDAYWQYVGFTLFSIVTMEAGTARRPRRTPRGGPSARRSGRRVDARRHRPPARRSCSAARRSSRCRACPRARPPCSASATGSGRTSRATSCSRATSSRSRGGARRRSPPSRRRRRPRARRRRGSGRTRGGSSRRSATPTSARSRRSSPATACSSRAPR